MRGPIQRQTQTKEKEKEEANVQRQKVKQRSDLVDLVPRGRVFKGRPSSSWEVTKKGGSRQSSADSGTKSRDKARPSTQSPRSSTWQEPFANQRKAGETRHDLMSRPKHDFVTGPADQELSQAWRDADVGLRVHLATVKATNAPYLSEDRDLNPGTHPFRRQKGTERIGLEKGTWQNGVLYKSINS